MSRHTLVAGAQLLLVVSAVSLGASLAHAEDGAAEDGAAEDGATEDGAAEDGSAEDDGVGDGEPAEYGAEDDAPAPGVSDVSVFGDARSLKRVAGPAHKIGEAELERWEDDNVERILPKVPGVYVRGEDGYGLRPNIGMRGANSDRSSKVNLLEDGVLLGPAPYSAPAAYYFPLMTRMTGVEVFKGPSAIRYGPNTIGGTINFLTRPIPHHHRFGADLAAGAEYYGKAHGHYGYGGENWGVLIEGVRLRSDGFKELDPAGTPLGDNTGFDKLELMGKARINTDPAGALYNEGTLKVTYSREVSHETYTGLTDDDFRDNPLRRYAATGLDEMRYQRVAFALSHGLVFQDDQRTVFTLRTTAYRHDFHRAWRKLNGFFSDATPLEDILANPRDSRYGTFYDVLTGARNSTSAADTLAIGTNDRTFVSQGIQSAASWRLPELGPLGQRLQLGLRLHNDSIERVHTADPYAMRSGRPIRTGGDTVVTTHNVGSAVAVAGYVVDEISIGPVMITPGIRMEYISTNFEDVESGLLVDGEQRVFLPGVGAIYQPLEALAILGGVHQGFSPVSPGQFGDVQPEVATNYELGARLTTPLMSAEVTRFVSDYHNLSGVCTFSSGCSEQNIDRQFNAGAALITGLEANANLTIPTPIDLTIPVALTYTFTRTELLTSFSSDNPQLGDVQAGDELPYVPMHQASGSAGFLSEEWGGLNFGFVYTDHMREQAGHGEPAPGKETDSFVVFDLSASLKLLPELSLYGKVENLLDNDYIVSRRPYGARPGRPRFIYGGVKITIDR